MSLMVVHIFIVYRVKTQELKAFGDIVNEYCKGIFKLLSINFGVIMDSYEWPSIKDGTRKIRASKNLKEKSNTRLKLCKR